MFEDTMKAPECSFKQHNFNQYKINKMHPYDPSKTPKSLKIKYKIKHNQKHENPEI